MQVHASQNYSLLGPILLGACAVAGAWLDHQLGSKVGRTFTIKLCICYMEKLPISHTVAAIGHAFVSDTMNFD